MILLLPSRSVALELFGFELRWYGLLYLVAFVTAWWLLPRLQKYRGLNLTRSDWISVITWGIAGVLLGGRLGYVLLYEPAYFAAHPLEIFALWRGGMASHGGLVGVAAALMIVARQLRIDFWALLDVVVVPAALGLALGRVGNWINQELYMSAAAHAAAVVKNLIVAGMALWALRQWRVPGSAAGVFLVAYGVLRFVTEFFRIQEWPHVLGLTRGQLYTLPLIALGAWLVARARKDATAPTQTPGV